MGLRERARKTLEAGEDADESEDEVVVKIDLAALEAEAKAREDQLKKELQEARKLSEAKTAQISRQDGIIKDLEARTKELESARTGAVRESKKALEALDADVFVPGHGPPGGPEVLAHQAAYHEAVQDLIAAGVAQGASDEALVQQIRQRFPDYRLAMVLPTTVTQLKAHVSAASKRTRN